MRHCWFQFALVVLMTLPASTQTYIEGGALYSPYFDLSDSDRMNATEGWDLGATPTLRVETWWARDEKISYGITLLPFYLTARDTLAAPLEVDGTDFAAGERVQLRYQFHNARGTAAIRLLGGDRQSLRVGGTLIVRYADIRVSGASGRARNGDLVAFPLLHVEWRSNQLRRGAWLARADLLPFSFRQGLYDVFLGWEPGTSRTGVGRLSADVRLFWGGFSPRDPGQNNNEIFFVGPVVRFRF